MIRFSGIWSYLFPFLIALILSVCFTPVIIKLARRFNFVALPREDRWHKKPTALMGGVGIFLSFIISAVLSLPLDPQILGILVAASMVFLLGLVDDILCISPQVKIIFQIAIALVAVYFGIYIKIISVPYIALPLTVLWIVGITNAFNILDNIDGLAAGISFVSGLNIFIFSIVNGDPVCGVLSIILVGLSLGFLFFNFNPAKIFMGDSGSLFLGFMFSLITIIGTWKTVTNLFVTLIVPLAIMIIPIFDVSLVTFSRLGHKRAIHQGGKDHSSHRLVFLGFSEKKAVVFLTIIGGLFGATSIILSKANLVAAIFIILLLLLSTLFFGIFLGGQKIYGKKIKDIYAKSPILNRVILYKKQILQIGVDLILIIIAHISSYLLRYEGEISQANATLIQQSLPLIIIIKLGIFTVYQLYKGEWKYISISDLIKFIKAAFVGSVISIFSLVYVFRFAGYSRVVFILDFLLTLILIFGFRILIRIFNEYFATEKILRNRERGVPILILGAGDFGELVIREIRSNLALKYHPVGFLDDNPEKLGKVIHGIPVLGDRHAISQMAKKYDIKKIFVAILHPDRTQFEDVINICRDLNIECEFLKPYVE
jgi:UDP-GlcNAc:undecaprenyl-phosphate GlcNAc-1-phosphate transferase